MSLETIRAPVKDDLESTDNFIITQLKSHIPLIQHMLQYILSSGGKRIRPLILLLSTRALKAGGTKHIDLAAVIELIHTATLLHDDVVDSSTVRRGHKTANTIWGNEASVLVGDFLYSRAFQIVVDLKHDAILNIFASAVHYIAEGEILQLMNCNNPDTTEEFYFEIIQRKTAKLFEVAAELGAILCTTSQKEVAALRHYGLNLGIAYQLIDDALDYSQTLEQTGKNVGQDLAEGKTTLPFISALQKSKAHEGEILRKAITDGGFENLETIIGIIESTGAIKYTANAAKHHAQQAKSALSSIPSSPYRKALDELSDFVVERTF